MEIAFYLCESTGNTWGGCYLTNLNLILSLEVLKAI